MQLSLFDAVKDVYARADGPVSNEDLYRRVSMATGITMEEMDRTAPIGQSGKRTSPIKRAARWAQQSLKAAGLLEKTPERGRWTLTKEGKTELRKARPNATLVAFSTDLGVGIWSLAQDVFSKIDEPITLALTSPPYPLRTPRAYGNAGKTEKEYIEFVVENLRPIAKNLVPGGAITLNIANDIFQSGVPSRSLYCERLVLAICDELNLSLMDRLVWVNPSKCPGPTQWACKTRQQLKGAYEPIFYFTNDPKLARSNNRRVLQPHTERMQKLIASGGEKRGRVSSDNSHTVKPGSYSNATEGRIPTNVLTYSHTCKSQLDYKKAARAELLPAHGAPHPLQLAKFLIQFLSNRGDLVVDPFGGSMTTGVAAEELDRRWICTEAMWEYAKGSANRFPGAVMNEAFENAA